MIGRSGRDFFSCEVVYGAAEGEGYFEDAFQGWVRDFAVGYFFDRFIGDAGIVGQNFKGPVVGGELAGYSGHYDFSEIWTVVFRIVVIHIISSMNVRVFVKNRL